MSYLGLKMRKSLSCLFTELGVIPISEEADIHIYEIDIYKNPKNKSDYNLAYNTPIWIIFAPKCRETHDARHSD